MREAFRVTIEDALGEMRRRGLRVSAPRRLVIAALFAAQGPCSAEHLARRLELDLASVYRKLRGAGFSSGNSIRVLKRYRAEAERLEEMEDSSE